MVARKTAITVTLRLDGVLDVMRALRDMPKDANDELRDASLKLAQELAPQVAAAGRAEGRQAAVLAATVRARRDRVPVIVVGGTRRLGRNRKPAYKLLFGSEFGASHHGRYQLRQFRPWRKGRTYWIFITVDRAQRYISREWNKAADRVIRKFGGSRGG